MKVLFLGTSASWPLPRLGCDCPICSSSDKRDRRLRPALLVNNRFLFDAPPDIYRQLSSYPSKINKIKHIFITHAHLDHILGLYDLTHVYQKANRRQYFNLFLTESTLKGIRKVLNFPFSPVFNIHTMRKNETFAVDKAKISFFEVVHSRIPTFGIRIREEKILSYLPDVVSAPVASQRLIKGSDILILDGTNLLMRRENIADWGHADWEMVKQLVRKTSPAQVIFTHIGHGCNSAPHEKLDKFVQSKGGQNWHIGYDGMEIEV